MKNLVTHHKELRKNNWLNTEISYTYNSYGFRSESFDNSSSIEGLLSLGCSYTEGVGIHNEDTFAYQLSKKLGLCNWNLGQGGGGSDTCFRLAHHWVPKLKPKVVIMLTPDLLRTELLWNDLQNKSHHKELASPFWSFDDSKYNCELYETYIQTDQNGYYNREKNKLGIKQIVESTGATFISLDVNHLFLKFSINDSCARDLRHPGASKQTIIVNEFYKEYLKTQ